MGRWGDGEMGRWGDGEIQLPITNAPCPMPNPLELINSRFQLYDGELL